MIKGFALNHGKNLLLLSKQHTENDFLKDVDSRVTIHFRSV